MPLVYFLISWFLINQQYNQYSVHDNVAVNRAVNVISLERPFFVKYPMIRVKLCYSLRNKGTQLYFYMSPGWNQYLLYLEYVSLTVKVHVLYL